MGRLIIFGGFLLSFLLAFVLIVWFPLSFLTFIAIALIALGTYDLLQRKHAILRNFPIIGHLRYLLETIRPEIQQYFILTNTGGEPFNRNTRSIVYQRAKKTLDTMPFGTQLDINAPGFESIRHSLAPTVITEQESRVMIGGDECRQPYNASRLNISAMSFGALSKNAVMALNAGAKEGDFAHNTGEGGLSPYHLKNGGDLIWQIGTANFGCRRPDGGFDDEAFQSKARQNVVKMIEIKLSQGAKPSHGGVLPAVKITPEIATIRGIDMGQDCLSPPVNPEFSTPKGLLHFVKKLRELSDGKPVGFKLCIGIRHEFMAICKAMLETQIYPDFITVDGAEGGTGAAPLEFSDYLGEPLEDGLMFVRNVLVGLNLKDKITLICSGKIATGFDVIHKLALGADVCNSARPMMFALGCIQALQCNKNTCPSGVTTHNPRLMRGLVVEDKAKRVANYHKATMTSMLELAGAMGVKHLSALSPDYIFRRDENMQNKSYSSLYEFLMPGQLFTDQVPQNYAEDWNKADANNF